jgi:hypothetical protein
MRGSIPPLRQYIFRAWCQVKKCTGTTLPFKVKGRYFTARSWEHYSSLSADVSVGIFFNKKKIVRSTLQSFQTCSCDFALFIVAIC